MILVVGMGLHFTNENNNHELHKYIRRYHYDVMWIKFVQLMAPPNPPWIGG